MLVEMAFALALAQDSTTSCRTFGGQTVCETTRNAGWDAYNRARESAMRSNAPDQPLDPDRCAGGDWWLSGCTRGQHNAAREREQTQARVRESRERVMTLLRAGDCPAAVNAALETGDLQFATDVRAFCAAGQ